MKKIYKILLIAAAIILTLVLGLMVAIYHIGRRALPDYNQNVQLEGLNAEVSVFRDQRAVPHIFAKNTHDLYMVTGYLMAQDRLWQMDLLRRVTLGRLSEIFGADMVETDRLLRALRMSDKSMMVLDSLSPEMRAELEAFTNGVNQCIAHLGNKLPPEFTLLGYKPELWNPVNTINLIGYMAWDLAGSWQNEVVLHKLRSKMPEEKWMLLLPDMQLQQRFVYPDAGAFALLESSTPLQQLGIEIRNGSNNWALSGGRSATGKAMLANDMHLSFGLPGIWYQIHQSVEGQFTVAGVALPGAPAVVAGHNDHIAWGMTNLYVDEMDFYTETLNDDKTLYQLNGEWKPLHIKTEKIAVKGGDTVLVFNAFTHRGPIISDFKKVEGQHLSMRWTGNDYSNELRTIMLLNRARNWNDFRDAVRTFGAVAQNIVYADAEGNIGLQVTGNIPIRKAGNPVFVMPGETDAFDWSGSVPFEELPFEFNPPRGYVSSANNRTTGPKYPYYIGFWYDNSARIDRIREMIENTGNLDLEDVMNMQLDQTSAFAPAIVEQMLPILKNASDISPLARESALLLESWDYQMKPDAPQPAIFDGFYRHFMAHLLKDETGELFPEIGGGLLRHVFSQTFANPDAKLVDNVQTPAIENFDDLVLSSFEATVAELKTQMGPKPTNWKWGQIHQLTLSHPLGRVKVLDKLFGLNKGPYPVGGSFHTVNPMGYNFHKPYNVTHGASQRHIYTPGDWNITYTIIPTGTSGIPASYYYGMQRDMFLKGEYFRELWNREDIESSAIYRAVFTQK